MTVDSSVVVPLMHSRSSPPRPGIIVRLFLNSGEELRGSCKVVEQAGRRDTQWYDISTRNVVDASNIKGWMPAIYRNSGLIAVQKKYGVGPGELREAIKPLFYLMEAYGIDKVGIDRSTGEPVINIDSEVIQ